MPNAGTIQKRQNVISASFRRHTLNTRPDHLEIRQSFGKHGLAILDYQFHEKRRYTMPSSETPVRIQWGKTPLGVRDFYGYVNHYETVSRDNETYTQMYILGTSKVFNNSLPTTWHGMTHSGVAKEFARRHNLRSVVSRSNRILPAWSTGTDSDFIALKALADDIGFYCWIDGSTLYFLNPEQVLRSAANMRVPLLSNRDIHFANVTAGKNAPTDEGTPVRNRTLYGLDYRTNEFFQVNGGDKTAPGETINAPANNFNQAYETMQAAGYKDLDYYTIKAKINGSADVYPGNLIAMGPGNVDTDQQGYWFVTDATHQVGRDDFVTTLNGVRGTDRTPRKVRISTVSGVRRDVPAVVRNGSTWEAEVQEHVNA